MVCLISFLCLSCVSAEEIDDSGSELELGSETDLSSDTSDSNSSVYLILDNDADKENIKIGEEVTWEISVINLGNDTAKNVKVFDQLPEGLAYVSHTTTKGTFNPETGIWDIGDLAVSDGEVFLHIKTKALTTGEKINKANLTTDSVNLNENESYEEEEIDVEDDDDDDDSSKNYSNNIPKTGNPLSLILLSLFGIFTTFFVKSKK